MSVFLELRKKQEYFCCINRHVTKTKLEEKAVVWHV